MNGCWCEWLCWSELQRSRLLTSCFQIDVSLPCSILWMFAIKVKVSDTLTRIEHWYRPRMLFFHSQSTMASNDSLKFEKEFRFGTLTNSFWPCILLSTKDQDQIKAEIQEIIIYFIRVTSWALEGRANMKCRSGNKNSN